MKNKSIWRLAVGSLCLLLCATGCGKDAARPKVQGKVTFKGNPVGLKTLNLRSEGEAGESFSQRISIQADGTFSGEVPEPGSYKVLIEESLAVQEGVHKIDPNQPILPAKYKDPATTDLSWVITKGENKKDFELSE